MIITTEIPDDLVPWVAGVFTERFPTTTVGMSPEDAIRAVVLSWITTTLTTREGDRAQEEATATVRAAEEARADAVKKALEAARIAAKRLRVR